MSMRLRSAALAASLTCFAALGSVALARPVTAPGPGRDQPAEFVELAKELLGAAACGDDTPPAAMPPKLFAAHCAQVHATQTQYRDRWVTPARAFFAQHVPGDVPRKVVYPFAGGDLSTALTVYPDADEITTISLEPAGDPRSLRALPAQALQEAMLQVRRELRFLYVVNFSNTKNMIQAMRGGRLPTQLIFGLSALHLHGFEPTSLRYFEIEEDGSLRYLTEQDAELIGDAGKADAGRRNRRFANIELRFKRPGTAREQIYRHIAYNLNDANLEKDPRLLRHLEAKGEVAAMTKAASYLMSYDDFSQIRGYLLSRARWMVSDATGVAPKWGRDAGFEYETWGQFDDAHMAAGRKIAKEWRKEWRAEPKRELRFRFGYPDRQRRNHLVIMRRTKSAQGK